MSRQTTRFAGLTVTKMEKLKNGQSHPDDEMIVEITGKEGDTRKTIFLSRFKTKTLRRVAYLIVTSATTVGASWSGHHLGLF
jgi:hypothetical protein